MYKLILLLKRRPDFSVEEFRNYWRTRHGPILTRTPGLRRYVQSHALPQGYNRGELLFDGIAELWFDDEAAVEQAKASPEFGAAMRDAEAFLDMSRLVDMPVDVHVVKDGVIPPNAVKNIEFVNRRPGMTLEPFRRYWREVHGPIASEIPVLRRYEQNHLKPSAYAAGEPPYDGLAITWFQSRPTRRPERPHRNTRPRGQTSRISCPTGISRSSSRASTPSLGESLR